MKHIYTLVLLAIASAAGAQQNTYQVKGRFITDPCGDTVILRGVNKMVLWRWFDGDGLSSLHEIAKTGANCVRIVWDHSGTADMLNTAITTCENEKMIPIIELHDDDPADNTNEVDKLPLYMNYWMQDDILTVVKAHQSHLLLNIVNELGTFETTTKQFTDAYKAVITQFRNAGVHVPLIIDASGYGQNITMLEDAGPVLTPYDPDHNIIYSVHLYWRYDFGDTDDEVTQTLQQSVDNSLPLIVGEFCKYETNGDSGQAVSYKNIMAQCNAMKIGYLAWEWGPGNLGGADGNTPVPWVGFTTDGTFETLYGWGYEVGWSSPDGIHATSVKTHYLLTDSCASLLPVNITSLTAVQLGKATRLNWVTATETNNKGFSIQRSSNATDFTNIGFVPSQAVNGTSSQALSYTFTDVYYAAGTTYYRLKQTDKDNSIRFSKTVSVAGFGGAGSILYPNPARSMVNIRVAAAGYKKISVIITDVSGKRVMVAETTAAGEASIPVNVSRLAAGTYFVNIQSGNSTVTTAKLVKQ